MLPQRFRFRVLAQQPPRIFAARQLRRIVVSHLAEKYSIAPLAFATGLPNGPPLRAPQFGNRPVTAPTASPEYTHASRAPHSAGASYAPHARFRVKSFPSQFFF